MHLKKLIMPRLVFVSVFVLLLFNACEKPPSYDETPFISWGSFSVDTVDQLNGVLTVAFNFEDGDGDLGNDTDTSNHIILVDTRRTPNDTLFYRLPEIEPQGVVSSISGKIEVTLSQLCCIDPNNPLILCNSIQDYYDPIVYKIRIRDNAGRWSNEIESPPLYVKCF